MTFNSSGQIILVSRSEFTDSELGSSRLNCYGSSSPEAGINFLVRTQRVDRRNTFCQSLTGRASPGEPALAKTITESAPTHWK